jgi:hypothetical protein
MNFGDVHVPLYLTYVFIFTAGWNPGYGRHTGVMNTLEQFLPGILILATYDMPIPTSSIYVKQ